MRILIVDDHKEVSEVFAEILHDHVIDVAATANEAASQYVRRVVDYNIVLMDIALRESSGVVATLALRALGYTGPVLVISGGLAPTDEELLPYCRFTKILSKPISPELLVAEVEKAVVEVPSTKGV